MADDLITFTPSSSEVNVKITKDLTPEDSLYYSVYGSFYYSWIKYDLTKKEFLIINLIPNTLYIFNFNNKHYEVKTLTETEEIINLKVELNHIRNTNLTMKKLESDYNVLKQKYDSLSTINTDRITKRLDYDNYIVKINSMLNEYTRKTADLISQINILKKENEELKTKDKTNENEEKLQNELIKKSEECAEIESKYTKQISNLNTIYDNLDEEYNLLYSQFANYRKEVATEKENLIADLNNLKKITIDNDDKYADKIKYLEDELRTAEDDYYKLTHKTQKMLSEINTLKKEKDKLNKQINNLIINKLQ